MSPRRHSSGLLHEHAPLLGLIAILFAIYFAQAAHDSGWDEAFEVVPASVVASWRQLLAHTFTSDDAMTFGTLLTYAFLHGDLEHVLYNCLYLWIFAGLVVEQLGQRWMFTIFVVTAISGGVLHTILNATGAIPMLGASGAVMGFEGAYLGLALRRRLPDPSIWPIAHPIPPIHLIGLALAGLALDFAGIMNHDEARIAYGAHIGGFVGGLFLTSFVTPTGND